MNSALYCGGPSVPLHAWLAPGLAPADLSNSWPQFHDRLVIGTYRGRTAVALACRLLGIGQGHEVLVPSYHCGSEIDALLHSGARAVGYQVSRECKIDLQDLIARRSSRTRAVYLIHYFGWEQPMQELRRWCDEEGLLLIEDCALALFSAGETGAIGLVGDAAIYSLPKTLGCCHGGLLSLPASRVSELSALAPAGLPVLLKEMRRGVQAAVLAGLEKVGLYGLALSARRRRRRNGSVQEAVLECPPMPPDYYFNPARDENRAVHPRVAAAAGFIGSATIVQKRRNNYERLAGALDGIPGIQLLYSRLPDGVCPLSLPLLVSNRNGCVAALNSLGIEAFPWWAGFHRDAITWPEFPQACSLKHHLLTLPVHQGLDDRHLNHVARTAQEVFRDTVGRAKTGPQSDRRIIPFVQSNSGLAAK